MALGPESLVVNGQLLSQPDRDQYFPSAYGAQTVGVPQVSPSYPPFMSAAMGVSPGSGVSQVGGYGTADNNAVAALAANQNPHSLRVSPTWWAVIGLVAALMLLKAVHWRETILESGDEHLGVGPASEAVHEQID